MRDMGCEMRDVGAWISYPPSPKTTGLPVDECANNQHATARCRPEAEADNRVVAEGEDGYFSGTTGLPVGLHLISHVAYPTSDHLGLLNT
ncbi:MAG: hypothetical protein JRF69_05920 [Deltaproteobacteria bacterium]|nr:hypothetical protein [Deltaproteobacteria bacterium]MBW2260278.1 hypothetical protein [Deltaproteobacteria bacterium]